MTATSQPLLRATDLHVSYGSVAALRGVTVALEAGEIVAVLGANGAGKTTLMKSLAGLLHPRQGVIKFGERDITSASSRLRVQLGIALVPEGRLIFAPLTVRENLRLGMLVDAIHGRGQLFDERLAVVLELFPALRDRLNSSAGDLSGGQQQMVAIGRALMSKPQVLLLDEPSLGLAPMVIEDIFRTLLKLNEQAGLSVLIAEQNITNALSIADRGYVLDVGEVSVSGEAETLLRRTDIEEVYLGQRTAPGMGSKRR